MLIEGLNTIKTTFLEYKGTGAYIVIYIIALVYIFFKEENKKIKLFFIGLTACIGIITLNPIFSAIVEPFFPASVYWRMYWMFPLGITISYVITKIIMSRKGKAEQIILGIIAVVTIVLSGKLIYNKENYIAVNNLYKVPNEAYEIATAIMQDNTRTKKVMPTIDLVSYIRQVNPEIVLMYAREPKSYDSVTIVIQQQKGNVQYVTRNCKTANCNYIIWGKGMQKNEELEKYDYNVFYETDNYLVYKNSNIE